MSRAAIEQTLADHQAAFLARDPGALAATHSPDGTLESPAHGLVRGRDAIREIYQYWCNACPDLTVLWSAPFIEPPRAALFWKFEGTVSGPFFGEVRPGTAIKINGAAEYVFDADGIASVRHIFDFSQVLIAAGVLKIKPT